MRWRSALSIIAIKPKEQGGTCSGREMPGVLGGHWRFADAGSMAGRCWTWMRHWCTARWTAATSRTSASQWPSTGASTRCTLRRRPHLDAFLQRCAALFEIVVFTASQKVYAEQLLNVLDPQR